MARVRQFRPIPFGVGLDRATGDTVVDPRSLELGRNLVLRDNKYQVRWGIGTHTGDLGTILDSNNINQFSDVCCHVFHYVSAGLMAYVGYESSTGKVRLYKGDLLGGNITYVATMATLTANLPLPPIFRSAENNSIILIAHDEPNVVNRMSTQSWDMFANTEPERLPKNLTGNLDGNGVANIKFRGVIAYRGWMMGWGYGTNTDPSRPETLRICMPGDPLTWNPEHYFQVGVRDDSIMECGVGSNVLVIFKGGSWYRLVGTDRSNWEIQIGDTLYGVAFARSAYSINGLVYFWSFEGPRITTGLEPSRDLSFKLDLDAPAMTPGAAVANIELGWTVYVPYHRELWWCWPGSTTTSVMALDMRDSQEPLTSRWTTHVIGISLLHGILKDPSPPATNPSPGTIASITADMIIGYHATDPWAVSPGVANELTLEWTFNADVVGDEAVEVWGSVSGGSYTKILDQPLTNTISGKARLLNLSSVLWNASSATMTVAIRLRRRGGYGIGYTSTDPATWPSGSRQAVTVFQIPEITSLSYNTPQPTVDWSYSSNENYWEGRGRFDVTVTVTKPIFTKPTPVSSVAFLFNTPGLQLLGQSAKTNLAFKGYTTLTGEFPVSLQTSYTCTGGNNGASSFTVGYQLPNVAMTITEASGYLAMTYLSTVTGLGVVYLGKGSPREALALYVTGSALTPAMASSAAPQIDSIRYNWSPSRGEYPQLKVNMTGGYGVTDGVRYSSTDQTPTLAAGTKANWINVQVSGFTAAGIAIHGYVWGMEPAPIPGTWFYPDDTWIRCSADKGRVQAQVAARNVFAYLHNVVADGSDGRIEPIYFFGPWIGLDWIEDDTSTCTPWGEDPYIPW